MITNIAQEGRELGGDMRCCSPGHTAKYGSYTMVDLTGGQVLDIQLIHVHVQLCIYILPSKSKTIGHLKKTAVIILKVYST